LNLPDRLESPAPIPRLMRFVAHALEQARDLTASTGVAVDDKNQADCAQFFPQSVGLRRF
jgi:hypothetical protein